MCYITATEFKKNLGYYLELSQKEPVFISKNGKTISCLSSYEDEAHESFMKLRGCWAPYDDGKDYDEMLFEEIKKRCTF